nr:hypothetical protein [Tanacetum cinerariifolium]
MPSLNSIVRDFASLGHDLDTMADVNVNAPADQAPTMAPPTRTDDQILPHIRWVPIGKRNCYLDVEKSQSNPIYKIVVDILKHTDFFRAFTASSTIPSIYIQQFWDTVQYDKTAGCYKCQLDDQRQKESGITYTRKEERYSYCDPEYQEYLEKVAKHQRYIFGDKGSDPDSPAPKPAKATKKFKPSVPKACLRPPVTKPTSSQQPKPKSAPAKSHGKKRKLVTETFDQPSPARKSRPGLVTKRSKPTRSLRSVDESVAEGIPEKEPRFDDEEADVQRALEESLKSIYDAPRGPLPPVVIREPESGKYYPLPKTPKKKSPADQFIFQRHTSTPTGSSGHDESSSLYTELGLTDSEVESDEDVPGIDSGVQGEGQDGPNPDEQDEGQARPNPGEQDEGQARPNPGDAAAYQPQSSLVVHAGPNLEHMDLEATDVILEELASSTGTLSSLQHLAKDLIFGDLFFNDKPSKADNEKTTSKTEAESMVSVTIQQDMFAIPPMKTPIIDLSSRPDSLNVHRPIQAMTTETTTTIHPPPPQPQQSTTDSMLMKRIGELEHIMANLIQDNKHLEERDLPEADMKEILHQRMWETNSYKTHEDHMMLYEAMEKSMNRDHTEELLKDLAEAHKKKKKSCDSPNTPPGSPPHQPPPPPPPAGLSGTSRSPGASGSSQVPPPPHPPPSTNQEGQSHGSTTLRSSKTDASAEYKAWTTTDTRLRLFVSSTPGDLQMDDDMAPDAQAHSSDDEDIGNAHISKKNWASALASTYSPPPEDSLLAQTGDMAMFMDWFCKRQAIIELKPQDLEGSAFELVKVFHHNVIHLQYQMEECHKLLTDSVDESIIRHNVSKPLPVGGPPSQVTIQSDFFFNKDLEYLRYGSKGSRPALSISKMKAAYYPDVGLEQMVPDQTWMKRNASMILLLCMVFLTGGSKDNDSTLTDIHLYGSSEPSTTQRQEDSHYCHQLIDQTLGYQTTDSSVGSPICAKLFRTSMHILRGSKWCVMEIVEIPKTDPKSLGKIKKEKSENKGRVSTEMELELEHTQQGSSYEVSVSAEGVEE